MFARSALLALASSLLAGAAVANPLPVTPIVPPTLTPYVTPGETPQSAQRRYASYNGHCDRQRIMSIEGADAKLEPAGFALDAFGTASSAGWSNPQLILVAQSADGRTATLDFVACRPDMSAQVLTPVEAHVMLPLDRSLTRRVVIRTQTKAFAIDVDK